MVEPLSPLIAAVASSVVGKPGVRGGARGGEGGRFITISRQAGAGGRTLMGALVDVLRRADAPGGDVLPWTGYDRALIDEVVREHGLPPRRVATIETRDYPDVVGMLGSLGVEHPGQPSDLQVYHRLTETMRRLAHRGRVILVGRGGALATADLPGGVHLRLVAPLRARVANLAGQMEIPARDAEPRVRQLDKQRGRFFKRYWNLDRLTPDHFDLTINTARLSEGQIVETVLPLVTQARSEPHAVEVG